MTAQIHDQVVLDGEPLAWAVTAVEGSGGFDPAAEGLLPRPFSTACWRGWYARYAVVGDALVLEQLNAGLADADDAAARAGTGPRVEGRAPVKRTFRGRRYAGDGRWEEGDFELGNCAAVRSPEVRPGPDDPEVVGRIGRATGGVARRRRSAEGGGLRRGAEPPSAQKRNGPGTDSPGRSRSPGDGW